MGMNNELNVILENFYQTCTKEGYFVLPGDSEVLIYDNDEVVTLELSYNADNKLNINFYKDSGSGNEFVDRLMMLFSECVNKPTIVN